MAILWLDDIRDPNEHGYVGAVWARTYEEAVAALRTGTISRCSLDHDLNVSQTLGTYTEGERTGYHVLCFLEENPQYLPPLGIRVHSMNPAGRYRMERLVEKLYSTY